MLPPVGWPGSSYPSGTMTWTRTMPWSCIAPAGPSRHPLRGRAESHRLPIRRSCHYVYEGTGGHGLIRDDPCPLNWARPGGWVLRPAVTRRSGHRTGTDVRQDQRTPLLTALGRAQATAYPAGEYVGQESFMRAAE